MMPMALVKEVEPKRTQSGKDYWRANIAGVGWASTFDSKIGKLLADHKGSEVDVTTEKNGNYTNILSAVAPHAESSGVGGDVPQRDVLIVRQVALKAAVERSAGAGLTDKDITDSAQFFADWMLGGGEPPEPFNPEPPF